MFGGEKRSQRRTKIPGAVSLGPFPPSCRLFRGKKAKQLKKKKKKMLDKGGWDGRIRAAFVFLHASNPPSE